MRGGSYRTGRYVSACSSNDFLEFFRPSIMTSNKTTWVSRYLEFGHPASPPARTPTMLGGGTDRPHMPPLLIIQQRAAHQQLKHFYHQWFPINNEGISTFQEEVLKEERRVSSSTSGAGSCTATGTQTCSSSCTGSSTSTGTHGKFLEAFLIRPCLFSTSLSVLLVRTDRIAFLSCMNLVGWILLSSRAVLSLSLYSVVDCSTMYAIEEGS